MAAHRTPARRKLPRTMLVALAWAASTAIDGAAADAPRKPVSVTRVVPTPELMLTGIGAGPGTRTITAGELTLTGIGAAHSVRSIETADLTLTGIGAAALRTVTTGELTLTGRGR